MNRKALLEASENAALFMERQLDKKTGQLTSEEVRRDLAAQYKLPTLLFLTGRMHLAQLVLDNLQTFMLEDGDFVSYPDKTGSERKTDDAVLANYWPYINGWIAMAAQRMSRFEISVPARTFLESFYNPDLKGYGIDKEARDSGQLQNVDIFISSHLGLLALYFGDIPRAKEVGECITAFIDKQPDLSKHFLLRMDGVTGELIEKFPEDQASFYCVSQTEQQQLLFLLGYPLIFLYFLNQATRDSQCVYIALAEKILAFVLKCDASMYSFFLSHKAAYGAGLISKATGNIEYNDMCRKIVIYLLSQQQKEGDFVKELPLLGRLDQTTEIAIWLQELINCSCF